MIKLDMEMPKDCKDCIFCTGGIDEPFQCYITDSAKWDAVDSLDVSLLIEGK